MGTLTELQHKQLQLELEIQARNREKAGRVLAKHAKKKRWKKADIQQVRDMLGLDLPPSTLYSGTPMAFNGNR